MFHTTFFKVSWKIFDMATSVFCLNLQKFEDDLSIQLASDNPKESNLGVLGLEIAVATNFWILSCHQGTA
jgi:hypothetical protein